MARSRALTPKQAKLVKGISKGLTKKDAAKLAGYSDSVANSLGKNIFGNKKIERVMDQMGLTDKAIVKGLKTNFQEGIGVKATADTSIKVADLVFRLKGYLDNKPDTVNNTQVNIGTLNSMSDKELKQRLSDLQADIDNL